MKNNQQSVLNLLGLARRAKQTQSGEGSVLKSIQTGKAQFVFLAKDAGSATTKKFTDKCVFYHVPQCSLFTKQQLSQATGQSRTIICVTQSGFARKFEELLAMN
ncbi:MAG: ribosomal L7Ae/L30e/S12e/Gadd45 family protein [Limosilactobacillus sp.]|jgi:ribosomal protein L7Ae-like RNA K-turn-binding protein|uniref:L7Ae/L30e/S12e/Gadd45 family ribosomal protein n=1 Tax=Limosilactobacillus sp. TaxID=2773925 RepID=UPI0025B98732|nr:ribosomal L7Ae/L30e/S12e/Gadd45 family protein [Limosilactobacillus sp.]MCI1974955.1 ribosomal L7Ae/L30e/S12e/Gadd45 family protein [Limosilactobacillus sp.]MCI2030768.1 ribosomal L7Ae/L30e/S12e/Gadd45 family protein [Limosilactobacillus sp.]